MRTPAETCVQARSCCDQILVMTEETVAAVDAENPENLSVHRSIRCMLRCVQSLNSCVVLSRMYRFSDIWILVRSISELAINTSYLLISSDEDRRRWERYDDYMDAKWIENLDVLVNLGPHLDAENLAQMRVDAATLMKSGLYAASRQGTWSEYPLLDRALKVDSKLQLPLDLFTLLYRWSVKYGDAFVHSSPKAISDQSSPVVGISDPSSDQLRKTAEALAVGSTAAYALTSFVRSHYGMQQHGMAEKFGRELHEVFSGT